LISKVWPKHTLKDICFRITDGAHRSPPSFSGGLPMASVKNLTRYGIDLASCRQIAASDFEVLERQGCRPEVGDVLVAKDGATALDTVCEVKSDEAVVLLSSVAILRPDPSKVTSAYLRYFLDAEPVRRYLKAGFVTGAAIPRVVLKDFQRCEIPLPPLEVQRRITSVISSLDDLIENNRQRIALLEQMAQAIYREWFVHFRYPGHEDDELVDSPLGPIPVGWRVRPVEELAAVVRGRSYRKRELVEEGGVPFINLKCMERGGGFRRDGLKRYAGPFKPEQLTSAGDIVLAVTDLTQSREILARATLVPRLSEESGVISLDVVRLVPKSVEDRIPLFAVLRYSDLADRVKEHANGSTVLHLSPDHVAAALIIWPSEPARRRAADLLGSMYSLCDELSDAADRLSSIRDILLPKLVTGAIDVSKLDLDALLEESAA
jgi:type I restriction enzyme, S subunit